MRRHEGTDLRDVATCRRQQLDAAVRHVADGGHDAVVAEVVRKRLRPLGQQLHHVLDELFEVLLQEQRAYLLRLR